MPLPLPPYICSHSSAREKNVISLRRPRASLLRQCLRSCSNHRPACPTSAAPTAVPGSPLSGQAISSSASAISPGVSPPLFLTTISQPLPAPLRRRLPLAAPQSLRQTQARRKAPCSLAPARSRGLFALELVFLHLLVNAFSTVAFTTPASIFLIHGTAGAGAPTGLGLGRRA